MTGKHGKYFQFYKGIALCYIDNPILRKFILSKIFLVVVISYYNKNKLLSSTVSAKFSFAIEYLKFVIDKNVDYLTLRLLAFKLIFNVFLRDCTTKIGSLTLGFQINDSARNILYFIPR